MPDLTYLHLRAEMYEAEKIARETYARKLAELQSTCPHEKISEWFQDVETDMKFCYRCGKNMGIRSGGYRVCRYGGFVNS